MKRFTFIVAVALVFGMASCTKENIQPNTCSEDVPTWRSVEDGDGSGMKDPSTGGSITDPDHDTDANGYSPGTEN